MTLDSPDPPDGDPFAQLARIVYDQMNIEPRRMHLAIDLAKQHLDAIRLALVEQGFRRRDQTDT